ncbi:MAG: hypothetical protein KGV57_04055 [Fusobacterium sp.]|nr:hypothetical protein [Fusobacterium sp.]
MQDFAKFLEENKKNIIKLAKKNAKYDKNGSPMLSKKEVEEDKCWDEVYKEI